MNYKLELSQQVEKDLAFYAHSGDKKLTKKILGLFEELKEHPKTGTGKPEQLKGCQCFSRRINGEHRLVYRIDETRVVVIVIAARGHYGDK